ncbi:nicotinate-nucleotide adenylyltransferase [Methylophaga sp. OBS3]|uniref:nicotinate-nucleotide adenylyltransferase n=1 Tax=Methylophaga sp. OBS3 TaxID=2991934 RepID=UPI002259ABD7|nr:nicotinate-nucleotide adenylyltransferase [Methylophaga sp. OBS3]MCX4190109.1 nicotinate-nucleotide adenylyltransferase [Methylophaga sp. OBS3]
MVKSVDKLPGIGVFGGTFDPVHIGHLRSALEVCHQLDLDHVRLMPCHVPPHRTQPQLKAAERRLLLELAVKTTDELIVDDRELQREGPSYSVDTLLSLREEYPDNPIYLILGTDAFRQIETWSRWTEILTLAHIVVIQRAGEVLTLSDSLQAWFSEHQAQSEDNQLAFGKIWPLAVTALAISATDIRAQRAAGQSVKYLIPEAVLTVIEQLGFYPAKS